MDYLTEYRRLSGIGLSLVEKTMGDPMLDVLSKAFSTIVTPADIKFIRYRKADGGVELEDEVARLGGILTSVEPKEANLSELITFLKKHGAKPLKNESLQESVASEILKQLGGAGRLKAMLGAKAFIDHGKALSFKFPNKKRTRGNYVKIVLTPDDLYDMEFMNLSATEAKPVKTYSGIGVEQLIPIFERQTGLRIRL